jgi:hypothetical protein
MAWLPTQRAFLIHGGLQNNEEKTLHDDAWLFFVDESRWAPLPPAPWDFRRLWHSAHVIDDAVYFAQGSDDYHHLNNTTAGFVKLARLSLCFPTLVTLCLRHCHKCPPPVRMGPLCPASPKLKHGFSLMGLLRCCLPCASAAGGDPGPPQVAGAGREGPAASPIADAVPG